MARLPASRMVSGVAALTVVTAFVWSGCSRESPNLTAPANAPRADGQLTAAWAGTITKFDVSGAGTVAGTGTQAFLINPEGAITGIYIDNSSVNHGFVRAPDGTITKFDAPGAGSTPNSGQGTTAISINPEGQIAGYYVDGNGVFHGFVRARNGTITTVDDPQAGGNGTLVANINEMGDIAGYYVDGNGVLHGFARRTDGTFTTFDAPGAGTSGGLGTITCVGICLSATGAVTGWYSDQKGVDHGYVRAPNGTLTEFDVQGAAGTFPQSINLWGEVAIQWADNSGVHGAVRDARGVITKIDVPGATGTAPEANNAAGIVDGVYSDGSGASHGFVRTPDGTLTKFDVPGAGTGAGQGTVGQGISPRGVIAGYWVDGAGVNHGYVRTPSEAFANLVTSQR